MTDGKPTIRQIYKASQSGALGKRRYELVTVHGVEILMPMCYVRSAIEGTAEFTHSEDVIKLAEEMNIKLRKFR